MWVKELAIYRLNKGNLGFNGHYNRGRQFLSDKLLAKVPVFGTFVNETFAAPYYIYWQYSPVINIIELKQSQNDQNREPKIFKFYLPNQTFPSHTKSIYLTLFSGVLLSWVIYFVLAICQNYFIDSKIGWPWKGPIVLKWFTSGSSLAEERPGCLAGHHLEQWWHHRGVCSILRHFGWRVASDVE